MADKDTQRMEENQDDLKTFLNVLSSNDNNYQIINKTPELFSKETTHLDKIGKSYLEKIGEAAFYEITDKKAPAPTLNTELTEFQYRKDSHSASGEIFKPQFSTKEKNSSFFKDIKYKTSIDKFSVVKEFPNQTETSTYGNWFDKSVGVQLKQQNKDKSYIKYNTEYELLNNTVNIGVSYYEPSFSIGGKVYLDDGNPGVSAKFAKKFDTDNYLHINAAYFKEDAAFNVNYSKTTKDNTRITLGGYGSTLFKEVGVYGKLYFYTP